MASTTGWEYLLNIALFAPLGLLASLVWPRLGLEAWVLIGFALSAALETMQFVALDERSATVSDLSANTVGAFIGALVAALLLHRSERRRVGPVAQLR